MSKPSADVKSPSEAESQTEKKQTD